MIGNIIIGLSAIFIFLFISQGNLVIDKLEHLANQGVLTKRQIILKEENDI